MAEILDVGIYESGTGGDIVLENEDIQTIQGFSNQVYLALFGGNTEQNTSINLSELSERNDWWGNEYLETENQFNSNYERALNEIALTSAGISTLEDAAKKDLKYFEAYADITITGFIEARNRFRLDVLLKQPGKDSIKIIFIWDGTKNEVIQNITL